MGGIISHEKMGELVFSEQGNRCLVVSNGHPADVVLSDLAKVFAEPRSGATDKAASARNDTPRVSNAQPVPVTTSSRETPVSSAVAAPTAAPSVSPKPSRTIGGNTRQQQPAPSPSQSGVCLGLVRGGLAAGRHKRC